LVVNDQVKLASDTIRPVGRSAAKTAMFSLYDPPEARTGTISAASDVWGLGVTTVEALTQHPPTWQGERFETAGLPTTLPATFSDALRRCLSQNPANRPTTTDLAALFQRPPPASVVSAPQPVVREAPLRAAAPQTSAKQRVLIPAIAVLLITLLAVWAGTRLFRSHPNSRQSASTDDQPSSQQAAASQAATSLPAAPEISAPSSGAKSTRSKPASARAVSPLPGQSAQPLADVSPSVVHEQIPVVPRSARETIHGRIRVAVLVIVDRSGKVIDATLENPGPSGYFARLAREAAGKWKFSPAGDQDSRKYSVTFEFTRSDTTGKVAAPRS
jgi:TonB family protein